MAKSRAIAAPFVAFQAAVALLHGFVHLPFMLKSAFLKNTLTGSSENGAGNDGTIMLDLAIVGGGPGGLMSAWYLKRKLGELCRITIFEATDRLRGKILTRKFDSAPATYEAGVAEIYDYSMTGPDPL